MTDLHPSPPPGVPYVGQKISLISKSAIRYVGTLYTIDTKASTVALKDVRSYGTEGRPREGGPIEPSDRVYTFIVFRGPDITDLQFLPKDSDVHVPSANVEQQRETPTPSPPQRISDAPKVVPPAPADQSPRSAPVDSDVTVPSQKVVQQNSRNTKAQSRRPVLRGPTPRAWGPPPMAPKEMRDKISDRQPVQPIAPRKTTSQTSHVDASSGTKGEGTEKKLGQGIPSVQSQSFKKPVHTQNPMSEGQTGSGHMKPRLNGHALAPAMNKMNGGKYQRAPQPTNGPPVNINGVVPGAIHRPNPNPPNGYHSNQMERGYRGGRGRGRGRGGRFHGTYWRRGPGIQIPKEDFDFESMHEKFAAAKLESEAKQGTEEFRSIDVCYDKSKSFFDELIPEKEMRTERVNAAQRRATDFETFGETGGYHHRSGYRSGRGRRGRGRGRGRGNRYGGAPRQDVR